MRWRPFSSPHRELSELQIRDFPAPRRPLLDRSSPRLAAAHPPRLSPLAGCCHTRLAPLATTHPWCSDKVKVSGDAAKKNSTHLPNFFTKASSPSFFLSTRLLLLPFSPSSTTTNLHDSQRAIFHLHPSSYCHQLHLISLIMREVISLNGAYTPSAAAKQLTPPSRSHLPLIPTRVIPTLNRISMPELKLRELTLLTCVRDNSRPGWLPDCQFLLGGELHRSLPRYIRP